MSAGLESRPTRGARPWCALLACLVCLGAWWPSPQARAHPLSFGVMSVTERSPGTYELELRFSGDEDAPSSGAPVVDARCRLSDVIDVPLEWGVHLRGVLRCPGGLVGRTLGVSGVEGTTVQVQLVVTARDGATQTAMLDTSHPTYAVRSRLGIGRVLVDYGSLGVEHIALGFDHLLLVLGLLLAARSTRELVTTVTCFTLGHSVTLAVASLGWVSVPGPPVEATIALSLVLLAAELTRRAEATEAAGSSMALVAAVFGLLHGLGFAGALAAVGLPSHAIVPALVGFNLGVEAGQLAFVLTLLAVASVARRTSLAGVVGVAVRRLPEAIGVCATYFLIDRLIALGT